MKCIKCAYYPCMRIECEPNSNCEHYKSIVTKALEEIDNRAMKEPINIIYNPKKY